MQKKLRVGVLFGGRSGEHDVSIASATSVIQQLNSEKYEIVPIGITIQGTWLYGITPLQLQELEAQGTSAEEGYRRVTLTSDPQHHRLIAFDEQPLPENGYLDVIFPVLHGTYGEDGTLQGLLEMARIPYVGCGVLASALGMDKEKTKQMLRFLGARVVAWSTVTRRQWEHRPRTVLAEIEAHFAYPCFVKPANLGSSVGVSKAHTREELRQALDVAAEFDRKMIVEEAIDCREFSCAVLGNTEPQASVIGEIIAGHEFSDYRDKYIDHEIQFVIPSTLNLEVSEELRTLARDVYEGLDLCGLARVDFFLDKKTNQFYVNEVNTLPGFTSQSLYPQLWTASGLAYSELLDRLIDLAFEAFEEKQRNRTNL